MDIQTQSLAFVCVRILLQSGLIQILADYFVKQENMLFHTGSP